MSNYYEDTMPLLTNENEYLKYFIDESLPLFDKLNIIIKKGQPFQRQALLNNLNIYISSSLFKPLIEFIISEIGTWDIETVLLFPKCLHNLLIKNLSSLDKELFNIIFKHIIISIASGNEKLSKEYIYYFNIVIEYYTQEFNNNKKFPFIIGDDIYEIIFSLGKFGQSAENKRLCCYLSSCMCRFLPYEDGNENIQKMFNRICFLFCDLEKTTESQISRELNYLIPIFKGKILEKNDIIQAIKSYLNHDSDHIIQATTIISLLNNIKYIDNELKELMIEKINEIFEDNNYENEHKDKIVDIIINSLYNECLKNELKNNDNEDNTNLNNNENDELHEIINKVFNMNFMKNFLNKEKIEPLLIINFDKISLILKNLTLNNYNNCNLNYLCSSNYEDDEGKLTIDDIFLKIYIYIFNKNYNYNNEVPITFVDDNTNEILKKNFVLNLYKIIPCLNSLRNSKCLYEKINHLFKKDSIISILKNYEIEFTSNNNNKKNNYLYKLLLCLLQQSSTIFNNNIKNINNNTNNNLLSNENNYYFKLFQNILDNIFSYYNQSPKLFTSQIHFLIAKTLQKLIKQIYKYYKLFPSIIKDKYSIDSIYDQIYNDYLFNIIRNQNFGNYIKIEYINVLPYLILYGKSRQSYLNFIEDEIIKSPLFYTRRYSINFIEKCLNIYSFNLFIKFNLLEVVYTLIHDSNNIISSSIIEKILLFHKKIIVGGNEVFHNICKILSKINKLNKDNKSVSIKNFDIEKNRTIKKILNLEMNNNENNKNSILNNNKWIENIEIKEEIKKIKERETKLILKENEIFGKDYQNISISIGFLSSNKIKNKIDKINLNSASKDKKNIDEINNQFNCTQKDKNNKRKLWIEKSGSGVIHNLSSKNSSKKFLPKLKNNYRKNSSTNNKQFDITFNINNNMNIINKINTKTLNINKLILNFKDKSPKKKSNFKLMNPNNNRLPSANTSIIRELIPLSSINSNNKKNNIFYDKFGNINFIDDNNYELNLNGINQNNICSDFMRYSGRMVIKNMISNNELSNNLVNGNKSLQNNKNNVHFNFKNGLKGMKTKKDNYFNISKKIIINAKVNEINKSNK